MIWGQIWPSIGPDLGSVGGPKRVQSGGYPKKGQMLESGVWGRVPKPVQIWGPWIPRDLADPGVWTQIQPVGIYPQHIILSIVQYLLIINNNISCDA